MATGVRVTVTKAELDMAITLDVTDCANCGVIFATSGRFLAERRADKRSFYCPNGHPMWFAESEADKLKAKLATTERQLGYAQESAERIAQERDDAKNVLRTTKGVVTKMRRRAMAGACPFGCHRTFADLQRHIVAKHADATVETVGGS